MGFMMVTVYNPSNKMLSTRIFNYLPCFVHENRTFFILWKGEIKCRRSIKCFEGDWWRSSNPRRNMQETPLQAFCFYVFFFYRLLKNSTGYIIKWHLKKMRPHSIQLSRLKRVCTRNNKWTAFIEFWLCSILNKKFFSVETLHKRSLFQDELWKLKGIVCIQ